MSALSVDVSTKAIFYELENYAYNGMELCRLFNGLDPFDSLGCHYTTQEKPWRSAKGSCKGEARGCALKYRTLFRRLKRLEGRSCLKSLKIRWMDHRDPGAVKNSIPLDVFRIWYTGREALAVRLVHDIDVHISPVKAW